MHFAYGSEVDPAIDQQIEEVLWEEDQLYTRAWREKAEKACDETFEGSNSHRLLVQLVVKLLSERGAQPLS